MFFRKNWGKKFCAPENFFSVIFVTPRGRGCGVHKSPNFSFFPGFAAFPASSQISQIWVNFGQKGPFLKFPPKTENVIIFRLQRLCFDQRIRKFWCAVLEKKWKTSIFGHFRPKRPILAKMAKRGKIIKKALETFFSHLQALTNCKV